MWRLPTRDYDARVARVRVHDGGDVSVYLDGHGER